MYTFVLPFPSTCFPIGRIHRYNDSFPFSLGFSFGSTAIQVKMKRTKVCAISFGCLPSKFVFLFFSLHLLYLSARGSTTSASTGTIHPDDPRSLACLEAHREDFKSKAAFNEGPMHAEIANTRTSSAISGCASHGLLQIPRVQTLPVRSTPRAY